MSWIIFSNNNPNIYHRKQVNDPSYMRLATSLMIFEYQPCEISEGLLHHQEDEYIAPSNFAASVGLGYMIKKLVSSNFMVMVSSVSVIIDTGATY